MTLKRILIIVLAVVAVIGWTSPEVRQMLGIERGSSAMADFEPLERKEPEPSRQWYDDADRERNAIDKAFGFLSSGEYK